MNVALLANSDNPRNIMGSKGVGEPPYCMGMPVLHSYNSDLTPQPSVPYLQYGMRPLQRGVHRVCRQHSCSVTCQPLENKLLLLVEILLLVCTDWWLWVDSILATTTSSASEPPERVQPSVHSLSTQEQEEEEEGWDFDVPYVLYCFLL